MKTRLFVAALAAVALVGTGLITGACSKSMADKNPRIVVVTNLSGKTLKPGDTVNLSWRCEECEDIHGDSVLVKLCPESNDLRNCNQIAFGPLTGSASWTVYATPGFYRLDFTSYPPSSGTVEPYYPRDAWGESGTFQIVLR